MKKLLILIALTIFISGCTVVRIDTSDIDNIVNVVLSKDNTLYNRVGKGYKYYIPRGVSYIDSTDLNEKFYSEGVYYFLYIDAIGYFYDREVTYEENDEAYYSKKIDARDIEGYVEVIEEDGLYYVQFMYNFAKIEAVTSYEKLNDVILNASYILSTVQFNENVIELMLNDDFFTSREESYDIFSAVETIETDLSRQYIELIDEEDLDNLD